MSKTIEELMNIKIIPEILNEVKDCKTEKEVKQVLLKNQSPALKLILKCVFDPSITFTIKELPAYRPDKGPIGISPSSLFVEARRLYVLTDLKDLRYDRKKEILIQMLESVHPSEAELIGKILKKNLGIPLLTEKLVHELFFPDK